jgi:hypothetical protein
LTVDVVKARLADTSSGSIGLVVSLLVALPEVCHAQLGCFLTGNVCLDFDGPGEHAVAGPEGTSEFGSVSADRVRVLDAGNDGRTVGHYVSGDFRGPGVSSQAEMSQVKADGFTADGGLRGIMRRLGRHTQSGSVGEHLKGCSGRCGEYRIFDVGGRSVRIDGDTGLEDHFISRNLGAIPEGEDVVGRVQARRDCGVP